MEVATLVGLLSVCSSISLYIIRLLSHRVSLTSGSDCVLFSSADSRCAGAHPLCSYVQLFDSLTLERAEPLLDVLFSHLDAAVKNGSLTESCAESFSLLYCHQVYQRCSTVNDDSGDLQSLCEDDCLEEMSECELEWAFLTPTLFDSLDLSALPSPVINCTTGEYSGEDKECTTLRAGININTL